MFTNKKLDALMEWLGIYYSRSNNKIYENGFFKKINDITNIPQGDFCHECGGFFKKDKLQKVDKCIERTAIYNGEECYSKIHIQGYSLYCPTHTKPYDKQIGDKYYKSNVEVNNKGKII